MFQLLIVIGLVVAAMVGMMITAFFRGNLFSPEGKPSSRLPNIVALLIFFGGYYYFFG